MKLNVNRTAEASAKQVAIMTDLDSTDKQRERAYAKEQEYAQKFEDYAEFHGIPKGGPDEVFKYIKDHKLNISDDHAYIFGNGNWC